MTKLSYRLSNGTLTTSYEIANANRPFDVVLTPIAEETNPISEKRKAMLETYGKVVKKRK